MRPNDELLQKIGQVRSKWKAFVWMRGLAWVLGLLVASLSQSASIWRLRLGVPFWVVRTMSLVFAGGIAAVAVWKLILPLRRVPDDTQLAQFVEEKNPGLEDRLVSAVEAIQKPKAEHGAVQLPSDQGRTRTHEERPVRRTDQQAEVQHLCRR